MKKSLADFNLFYTLFFPMVQFGTLCHYRKIVVRGKENLPEGEHYILAPTHQNAMMDPLVVLNVLYRPIAFLARADIFKNPVARRLLTWLRISPVYRIRDGRDQLSRNAEVFDTARRSLEQGIPLCLMAEGTHNNRHQLLPLVKGMFRIAGETQRELGQKPLYIVPVGLDYDHYETPYHSVAVEFGKPIPVQQYMAEFIENEPHALNHMRADLTTAMKALIHQVNSDEHYDDEYAYCHQHTPAALHQLGLRNTVWNRFVARRHTSQQLSHLSPAELQPLYEKGSAFAAECAERRVPLWFASKCPRRSATIPQLHQLRYPLWPLAGLSGGVFCGQHMRFQPLACPRPAFRWTVECLADPKNLCAAARRMLWLAVAAQKPQTPALTPHPR